MCYCFAMCHQSCCPGCFTAADHSSRSQQQNQSRAGAWDGVWPGLAHHSAAQELLLLQAWMHHQDSAAVLGGSHSDEAGAGQEPWSRPERLPAWVVVTHAMPAAYCADISCALLLHQGRQTRQDQPQQLGTLLSLCSNQDMQDKSST